MFESLKKLLHFQNHTLAIPLLKEAVEQLELEKEVLHDHFFRFKSQWNNLNEKIKQLEIHLKKLHFEHDNFKDDELKTLQHQKYISSLQKELKAYTEMMQELKQEMLHSELQASQMAYQIEKIRTKILLLSPTLTTDSFDVEHFLIDIHHEAIEQTNHEDEMLTQKIDHLLSYVDDKEQQKEDVKSFFKKDKQSDNNNVISSNQKETFDRFFSEEKSTEEKKKEFFNKENKSKIDRFFKGS
ncbi:hypothetical protein MY04_3930 [Flammeovirga sp. MY04]|uniref:hypothetical protein n=1 Tax=Flammeovirga sp. MY04 TaxID=1191459 RepID=UPI0008063767|nr:hypothetical protein [Flammeovirga sp. MY04]ANQ51274.1 hypothetical protein MY04_3930 [Flammeovirga sp. MY04]